MAGRGAGMCPSGMASMMVSSANASTVIQSTAYSSPQVAGVGAGMCLSGSTLGRTFSGRVSSQTLSSACSSPVSSGRGDSEWCVFESWCFWLWR